MVQFLRRAFWFAVTVTQALWDYPWRPHRTAAERAEWAHEWSAKGLRRMRVRYSFTGKPPERGLLVSNHLGYLDIMVYLAMLRCMFVSKAEVKSWPLFGLLADCAGTVYVNRRRRSDTKNANEGINRGMSDGVPVIIFPEGTSSDGSSVLPFYPSLFEPVVERRLPVTAAHLSYEVDGGTVANDVAYWGTMRFFPHLLKFLALGEVRAFVRFSDAPQVFTDRKKAALDTRAEVLRLKEGETKAVAASAVSAQVE